jgi:phenylalanyl-tRNA synthetase alpha chain
MQKYFILRIQITLIPLKMLNKIEQLQQILNNTQISSNEELEQFRIKYLSKKGILNELFQDFAQLPKDQKPLVGNKLNILKNNFTSFFENLQSELSINKQQSNVSDPSRTFYSGKNSSRHPVSIVRNEIISIFSKLGFSVSEGPEIEDDYHVFSALNFPQNHPARDMQDTFFISKNPDILLRTHTSSVQVRAMQSGKPPIRIIMPGRVFRNEAISARSHCIFHQVEGLYIDKNVSFADLKQTLLYFAQEMFGPETKIRLRPSFFPFTEPSAEMDISCNCNGKGCNLCKHSGWLEILGCGMVDPQVLENCNIDSKIYSGFAFGMGIERISLLKYRTTDIRLYFENDIRFIEQFSSTL